MSGTINQETFRKCMRDVDALIRQSQFTEARQRLQEAKGLDPGNPYVIAYEERISAALVESESGNASSKTAAALSKPAPVKTPPKPPTPQAEIPAAIPAAITSDAALEAVRQELSQQIRDEIEKEYRSRFMEQLQREEAKAVALIEEERTKMDQERHALQEMYERRIQEMQSRLEEEFGKKFDEEIAAIEKRLREEMQTSRTEAEKDLRSNYERQQAAKLTELEAKWKADQQEHLRKERETFNERERQLKEQHDRQLLESIRKTESLFQEQSAQQMIAERRQYEENLVTEFEAKLNTERAAVQQQYEELQQSMEQAFRQEQERLKQEFDGALQEQINQLRRQDEEQLQERRAELARELEANLKQTYYDQMARERDQLKAEAEAAVATEKERLRKEYEKEAEAQQANVQKVRNELRAEMEETFIKRLEQISAEYDHKMEVLGVKIPKTKADAIALYRDKMRTLYGEGEPSVEDAKKLMVLKEMLELTFDTHLAVESDIRLELYVKSVERMIFTGQLHAGESEKLNELKQRFSISPEEATRLEPFILSSFQRLVVKGRILIADDDPAILKLIEHDLTGRGFQVISASDVPAAMEKLTSGSVDLILSDIKFQDAELDGFKFFKLVQEKPHLRKLPFIFMSSLQDGAIVRSGIQLGVDDYLTKPVDTDLLAAIVEGKLKRFRTFN